MFPKILHLYWGKNRPMSYLRTLTVASFKKLNPDWDVRIWVPSSTSIKQTWATNEQAIEYGGEDYLKDLEGVRVFNFKEIGISEKIPEVHKSDLLRWYLLSTQMGIWSDFDVLYIKPITDDISQYWRGAGLCQYEIAPDQIKEYQAIGFMTSSGSLGRRFFGELFKYGLSKRPQRDYQAYGATLLEEFLEKEWQGSETPFYHDPDVVYPLRHNNEFEDYFRNKGMKYSRFRTIGLHWYAGNPVCAKCAVSIGPEDIKKSDIAICREARRIFYPKLYAKETIKYPEDIKREREENSTPGGRIMPIKYSILMPYFKRSDQLRSTLESFVRQYKNRIEYAFETIIVNDSKNPESEKLALTKIVEDFQKVLRIKVIDSQGTDCWNPAPAYNLAAQAAGGKYLVITNPECVHYGEILGGFDEEFEKDPDAYVVCAAFSVQTTRLKPEERVTFGQWYQHSQFRNVEIHFCTALHRENYKMVKGFDENYAKGYGFDDDDFRNRLKRAGIKFVCRDDLVVIHLAHPGNKPENHLEKYTVNRDYYDLTWGKTYPRAEHKPLGGMAKL